MLEHIFHCWEVPHGESKCLGFSSQPVRAGMGAGGSLHNSCVPQEVVPPNPNSAAFLGQVFPHGLEAEHPGCPMSCTLIWDNALLTHGDELIIKTSLLISQQIASLRSFKESTQQEWGWSNPFVIQFVKTHTTKKKNKQKTLPTKTQIQSEKAPQISLKKSVWEKGRGREDIQRCWYQRSYCECVAGVWGKQVAEWEGEAAEVQVQCLSLLKGY